jgi:hypothetical protein
MKDKEGGLNGVTEEGDVSNVCSESNVPDEQKVLIKSGHSKKFGDVQQVTAEIGITVQTTDSATLSKAPRLSSQVSNPGTNKRNSTYRVRYDSVREDASLESCESHDG